MKPKAKVSDKTLKEVDKYFSQGKWIDASYLLKNALVSFDEERPRIDHTRAKGKRMLRLEGALRSKLGHCLRRMGKFDEAAAEFERAKEIGKSLNDDKVLADALLGSGFLSWRRGENEKGKEFFNEAIKIAEKVHERGIKGRALMGLGNIAVSMRDLDSGIVTLRNALAELEKEDRTEIERARVMHNIAFLLLKQEKVEEAEEAFNDCLKFCETTGDVSTSGFAYSNLSHLFILTDRIHEAEEAHEKAGRLIARTDDRYGLTMVLWVKGLIKAKKGDMKGAVIDYGRAREAFEEMDLPLQILHMTRDYIPVFLEIGLKKEIQKFLKELRRDFEARKLVDLLSILSEAEKELED